MHVSMKAFVEMDFASYLRLGELDLVGLRQLCCCESGFDDDALSSHARDI